MGTIPVEQNAIYQHLADIQETMLALSDYNQDFRVTLHEIAAGIQSLNRMLAAEYLEKDHIEPYHLLSPAPLVVNRRGRRYFAIYSPVTVQGIAVDMLGVKGYTLTLQPGWNILNAPDGTILTAATGTDQPVIIKATNYNQAGAI